MNRKKIEEYISEKYSVQADYPFVKYPDVAVFRHAKSGKWFAVIMNIQKNKLGLSDDGTVDIINLKCDPILSGSLRIEKGFYPAYHMSKTNWISATLDSAAETEKIMWLIDISYELTFRKIKRREKYDDEF